MFFSILEYGYHSSITICIYLHTYNNSLIEYNFTNIIINVIAHLKQNKKYSSTMSKKKK